MISHRNVIANTMQTSAYDRSYRDSNNSPGAQSNYAKDVDLGLLPMNHIYSLLVICHAGPYKGDQVIVLPKFDLKLYLSAIQKFKISVLFVVCLSE